MKYRMNIRNGLIILVVTASLISLPISAQDRHTVGLYTFESISGNVLEDISGTGNDGEVTGAVLGSGRFQKGMVFGGDLAGDFVEIPDNESIDLTDALTVEMWLYLNADSSAGGQGVTKGSTYKVGPRSNLQAELRVATTSVAWGNALILSEKKLSLRQWTHIAGTYDAKSGEGKLYIDGVIDSEVDIGGGNIVPNDNPLWLGRGGTPFLDGRLDEVRISNIARSQNEIKQLMNIGIAGVLSVTPQGKLATTWGKLRNASARF